MLDDVTLSQLTNDPHSAKSETSDRKLADRTRFDVLARVIYYFSLVGHGAMIFLFEAQGETLLSRLNIFSICLIGGAILAHRRQRINLGFVLYSSEIVMHAVVATLVLGWNAGFFVYLAIPLMIMSFLPGARNASKLIVSVGLFGLMLGVIWLSASLGAFNPPERDQADMMLVGNFLLLVSVSGCFTFLFNRTIHAVEDELHAANLHLNRFARAVSEFLDPALVRKLFDSEDISPTNSYLTELFSDLAGSTRLSQRLDNPDPGRTIAE